MIRPSGISEQILSRSLTFLTDWETGDVTLDDCLDTLRRENGPERSAVASLLFEYFRHKGFVDGLIAHHAKKGTIRREMRLLLCCAVTQVFFQTGIARQSAVNVAVEFAKQLNGFGGGGFVNAMLRGILRDTSIEREAITPSFPNMLKQRWNARFGEERAAEIMKQYASNPPLAFRVRKEIPAEQLDDFPRLNGEELDFTGSFLFHEAPDPAKLFESHLPDSGAIYIQDPATTMIFSLLDGPVEGRFLDACAAPGGKTILMSDYEGAAASRLTMIASDRSQRRVLLLNRNLRRANIRCRTVTADACEMPFSPESFDCILADVPCSNTGVIRRRPDAPWRFSLKNLQELTVLQAQILDSLSRLLKPGGLLLYSTCSLEEEEDQKQTASFAESHPDFNLVKDRLLLPSAKHDGAYAAVLRRNK